MPSLRAIRTERQRVLDAIAKQDVEVMCDACIRTLVRIQRGEVKGLVIIESLGERLAQPFAAGVYEDDLDLLSKTLCTFGDSDFEWKPSP